MLEERMNRTSASVTGGSGPSRGLGADDGRFGFGVFAARYQPESFSGEDTGWRDWSRVFRIWAGRFQRGRVQEVIRAVETRPGDEATVTELDLRLDDWASAELKSVAALKIVLTNKEGGGLEAWRALVIEYEPTREAGRNFAHAV